MGTVYGVRHIALGRQFALKALRVDVAAEADLSERFLREAMATAAIRHPNVVAINDFGRLRDGRPYFVMERLFGVTLAQHLRTEGPMPAARVAEVGGKIARAVAAAHEAGIVHRDLKPDNVFLTRVSEREDDVRVVDFGTAIVAGQTRLTRRGIVYGTPHYMSPEQANGGEVGPLSDLYALGVMLYEMCTGRPPFEGDSYMGVLTQHMFARPVAPSRLRPMQDLGALEGLILACLEKKPDERLENMTALAVALDPIASCRMPELGGEPPVGNRRSRWRWAPLAVAGLLGVALLFAFGMRPRRNGSPEPSRRSAESAALGELAVPARPSPTTSASSLTPLPGTGGSAESTKRLPVAPRASASPSAPKTRPPRPSGGFQDPWKN